MDQSEPSTRRPAPDESSASATRAAIHALRPRQWTKNALVFAPLVAAGLLLEWEAWVNASALFIGFCCTASAMYLANDLVDADRDRLHPLKRNRPVASGKLPQTTALGLALALLLAGLAIAASLNARTALTVAAYAVLHICYSLTLKRIPIVEMLVVSAGFVLRGVAGGFAVGVVASQWFLLVTAAGALFVIAAKRYSELRGNPEGTTREALSGYDPEFLRGVLALAATSTVLGYVLWSFGIGRGSSSGLAQLTAVPFTLAILLVWAHALRGHVETPDVLLTSDRRLLTTISAWAVLYAAATLLDSPLG